MIYFSTCRDVCQYPAFHSICKKRDIPTEHLAFYTGKAAPDIGCRRNDQFAG
jgi:hypothetical protein